jgi:hypothetical protein
MVVRSATYASSRRWTAGVEGPSPSSQRDEVDLHADPAIGIVKPVGPDDHDGLGGRRITGGSGAHCAMSSSFVGVIVARWKIAIGGTVGPLARRRQGRQESAIGVPRRGVDALRVELPVERPLMGGEPHQLVGGLGSVLVSALPLFEPGGRAAMRELLIVAGSRA